MDRFLPSFAVFYQIYSVFIRFSFILLDFRHIPIVERYYLICYWWHIYVWYVRPKIDFLFSFAFAAYSTLFNCWLWIENIKRKCSRSHVHIYKHHFINVNNQLKKKLPNSNKSGFFFTIFFRFVPNFTIAIINIDVWSPLPKST